MSLVTVCIPTIPGREDVLARALASVDIQTYKPFETIVMLDENYEGPAVLRNRMAKQVKTKYIAWLDDDDEFLPEHLELLVDCAEREKADLVFPWFKTKGHSDPLKHFGKPWSNDSPFLYPIAHLITKKLFLKAGGFPVPDYQNDDGFGHEDWYFINEMVKHDPLVIPLHERTWVWHANGKNTSGLPRNAKKYAPKPPDKPKDIYVVLPVKNKSELTKSLLDELSKQNEYTKILLFDNGSTDDTRELAMSYPRLEYIYRPDSTIYEMWNEGWAIAQKRCKIPCVAFLNNDISISSRFLSTLRDALRADKNLWAVYPCYDPRTRDRDAGVVYTKGTYRQGGMCGFAFMIKGEAPIDAVDERFQWWYGDDDIAYKIDQAGYKIGRVPKTYVHHIGEATSREIEGIGKLKEQDMRLWKSLGRP